MNKKINKKNIAVSKSRNIASFVLNIISTIAFGVAAILFLASAFVVKWSLNPNSPGDHLTVPIFFGLYPSSDLASGGVFVAAIGYLLFIWARALRSQHKMASVRILTYNIITSVFLFLGVVFFCLGSPTFKSIVQKQLTKNEIASYSIIATIFLGVGATTSIIFNRIFYKDSLAIIILVIFSVVFQLLSIVLSPYLNIRPIKNVNVNVTICGLSQCIVIILVWILITRLINGQLINRTSTLKRVSSLFSKIFFSIFIAVFITATVLSISYNWLGSSRLWTAYQWSCLSAGIVFSGYLCGLTISISSGIYLNQTLVKNLG